MQKELRLYLGILKMKRRETIFLFDQKRIYLNPRLNRYRGLYNYIAFLAGFMSFSFLLWSTEIAKQEGIAAVWGLSASLIMGVGIYLFLHLLFFLLFLKKDALELIQKIES